MFLNAGVQISPWAAGTGNCRMLWHRLRAWPGHHWRACVSHSWLLAKDPFPLLGLCVPLLVFLGFVNSINPYLTQSSCARCGKPGTCYGQRCFYHRAPGAGAALPLLCPPCSTTPHPELAASSACWRGKSQQHWPPQLPVGYWVLKNSGALEAAG